MAKKNPFLRTVTQNGKRRRFDNSNQGVLYPRFDIREGALLGTFNHAPSGKELSFFAVPAPGGYALVVHDGPDIIDRGELKKAGGKIAYTGKVGELKIVAFGASNQHGRYLQIRPDKRGDEVDQRAQDAQAVLQQLDIPF